MSNPYNQENEEIEIDLGAIIMVLIGKIPMMIAVGLFCALCAFLVSKFVITPTYQSTTKIYVLNKQENSNLVYADLQIATQLTKDYPELIKSRYVLEEVIHQLNLDMSYTALAGKVSVPTPEDSTRIISITVTDSNPVQAMNIANAIREAASVHIRNVMDIEAVNVVETANLPTQKASPGVFKNTALGGMAGVFIIAAITVIAFLLNDTIKTSDDIERYLGLSTLAMIPINEGEKKKKKRVRR